MAKKNKSVISKSSSSRSQPNAPEYQQILYQPTFQPTFQPPLNPYYPDPASVSIANQAPPPYSQVHGPAATAIHRPVPMSQLNDISYPRINNGQASPILIQTQTIPFDYRGARRKREVGRLNTQAIMMAILAVILSVYAHSLYRQRPCIESFVVAKPNNHEVKISDVRDGHMTIAYLSGVVLAICVMKAAIGYNAKSNPCYLFALTLVTLVATIHAACLAYMAFFSPCVTNLEGLGLSSFRTVLSKISDSIPAPSERMFHDLNVINHAKDDPNGLVIFVFDVINFIFYLAICLNSLSACC